MDFTQRPRAKNPYSCNVQPAGGFETSTNAYKKQGSSILVPNATKAQNSTLRQSKSDATFDNEQAKEAYSTIKASDPGKFSKNAAIVDRKGSHEQAKAKSPR